MLCGLWKKKQQLTVLWCPILFPASLIINWGSHSTFAIISIAKIGLSFPREWGGGIQMTRGGIRFRGSHINMVYVYVPAFGGTFSWNLYSNGVGGDGSSETMEPKIYTFGVFWANYYKKHPIWSKLGAFFVSGILMCWKLGKKLV